MSLIKPIIICLLSYAYAVESTDIELVDNLPDGSFTATYTDPHNDCQPQNSRISSGILQAWCVESNGNSNSNAYLQIEFIQSRQLTSVTIYGRQCCGAQFQWVTSYYFQYSIDSLNWVNASNEYNNSIFTGNTNATTGQYVCYPNRVFRGKSIIAIIVGIILK